MNLSLILSIILSFCQFKNTLCSSIEQIGPIELGDKNTFYEDNIPFIRNHSLNSNNSNNNTTNTETSNNYLLINIGTNYTNENVSIPIIIDSYYNDEIIFMKALMQVSYSYTKKLSQLGFIKLLQSYTYCYNNMCPSNSERDYIIRIMFKQIAESTVFNLGGIKFKIIFFNSDKGILVGTHGPITCALFISENYIFFGAGMLINWKIMYNEQLPILKTLSLIDQTVNSVLIL